MKKKIFIQLSPISIFSYLLWLFIVFSGLYVVIDLKNQPYFYIFEIFVVIGVFLYGAYMFIISITYRVSLNKDSVYVSGSAYGKMKISYRTYVDYKEIIDMKLIYSTKNSLNKRIDYFFGRAWNHPNLFLVFTCKNGVKKRVFLSNFSRRQIIKIINSIKLVVSNFENDVIFKDTLEMLEELGKRRGNIRK